MTVEVSTASTTGRTLNASAQRLDTDEWYNFSLLLWEVYSDANALLGDYTVLMVEETDGIQKGFYSIDLDFTAGAAVDGDVGWAVTKIHDGDASNVLLTSDQIWLWGGIELLSNIPASSYWTAEFADPPTVEVPTIGTNTVRLAWYAYTADGAVIDDSGVDGVGIFPASWFANATTETGAPAPGLLGLVGYAPAGGFFFIDYDVGTSDGVNRINVDLFADFIDAQTVSLSRSFIVAFDVVAPVSAGSWYGVADSPKVITLPSDGDTDNTGRFYMSFTDADGTTITLLSSLTAAAVTSTGSPPDIAPGTLSLANDDGFGLYWFDYTVAHADGPHQVTLDIEAVFNGDTQQLTASAMVVDYVEVWQHLTSDLVAPGYIPGGITIGESTSYLMAENITTSLPAWVADDSVLGYLSTLSAVSDYDRTEHSQEAVWKQNISVASAGNVALNGPAIASLFDGVNPLSTVIANDGAILAQMLAIADVDNYDRAEHSLEAIGDAIDVVIATPVGAARLEIILPDQIEIPTGADRDYTIQYLFYDGAGLPQSLGVAPTITYSGTGLAPVTPALVDTGVYEQTLTITNAETDLDKTLKAAAIFGGDTYTANAVVSPRDIVVVGGGGASHPFIELSLPTDGCIIPPVPDGPIGYNVEFRLYDDAGELVIPDFAPVVYLDDSSVDARQSPPNPLVAVRDGVYRFAVAVANANPVETLNANIRATISAVEYETSGIMSLIEEVAGGGGGDIVSAVTGTYDNISNGPTFGNSVNTGVADNSYFTIQSNLGGDLEVVVDFVVGLDQTATYLEFKGKFNPVDPTAQCSVEIYNWLEGAYEDAERSPVKEALVADTIDSRITWPVSVEQLQDTDDGSPEEGFVRVRFLASGLAAGDPIDFDYFKAYSVPKGNRSPNIDTLGARTYTTNRDFFDGFVYYDNNATGTSLYGPLGTVTNPVTTTTEVFDAAANLAVQHVRIARGATFAPGATDLTDWTVDGEGTVVLALTPVDGSVFRGVTVTGDTVGAARWEGVTIGELTGGGEFVQCRFAPISPAVNLILLELSNFHDCSLNRGATAPASVDFTVAPVGKYWISNMQGQLALTGLQDLHDVVFTGEGWVSGGTAAVAPSGALTLIGINQFVDTSAGELAVDRAAHIHADDLGLTWLMTTDIPTPGVLSSVLSPSSLMAEFMAENLLNIDTYDRTSDSNEALNVIGGGGITKQQVRDAVWAESPIAAYAGAIGMMGQALGELTLAPVNVDFATSVVEDSVLGYMSRKTAGTFDRSVASLEAISLAAGLTSEQVRAAVWDVPRNSITWLDDTIGGALNTQFMLEYIISTSMIGELTNAHRDSALGLMTNLASGSWTDWNDTYRVDRALQVGIGPDQLVSIADGVWGTIIETDPGGPTDYTAFDIQRLVASAVAGTSSGHQTDAPIYIGLDTTTERIVATTNPDGRLTVVLDVS